MAKPIIQNKEMAKIEANSSYKKEEEVKQQTRPSKRSERERELMVAVSDSVTVKAV